MLSGTFIVSDQSGQRFVGRPGDVIYIPKGSTITFATEEGGKTFFVSVLIVVIVLHADNDTSRWLRDLRTRAGEQAYWLSCSLQHT